MDQNQRIETLRQHRAAEKGLQRRMVRWLRDMGFEVMDMTQPRATMMPVGLPDLYVRHTHWQLRAWIEVKTGERTLTPEQELWHKCERLAGGTVLVARSVDDVAGWIRQALENANVSTTLRRA